MGLLDSLFGKKDAGAEVKRLVPKVTQKFGPPENRQEALQRLVQLGTEEAFVALTQRFKIRVDPGTTDEEEKQYVVDSLVAAGTAAVAPLKLFVETAEQPTWGLTALGRMLPEADYIDVVLGALEKEGPDWTRDPEKKTTLMRHLLELRDARIAPRIVPFLADPSEEVRVSAVATISAQSPDDATHTPLVDALIAAGESRSERMRREVAEALVKLGFSVKGRSATVQAALPAGFSLDKEGKVRPGKA